MAREAIGSLSRRSLLQMGLSSGLTVMTSKMAGASAEFLPINRDRTASPQLQSSPSTFTLVTNRAPSDLDPHSAYDDGSGVALQGPYEGLIRLKPGTTEDHVPLLADSWTSTSDQSVWTFQLREGVRFHDGTPLDAEAARASFSRLLSLGLAPAQVLGRFITNLDMIQTPNESTLVFDLGRPQPLFEAALASVFGTAIVNVAALRQHEIDGDWGHTWAQTNSDGLGTGPYQVVAFDVADGVFLEQFDDYWGGWDGEHFDAIAIRVVSEAETRRELLERGDADMATTLALSTVPDLERNLDLVVDRRFNLAVHYLAMTVAGPLQDPRVRQALCYAFPYDEVIEGVYAGFAKRAVGPVAELCRGFAPETFVYQTDLERARELLREAGLAEGTELTLLLPAGNRETAALVELFQASLASIGVTLTVELADFATYVGTVLGDLPAEERPNLFPLFWQPDYNDGWNHLWPQVSCDAWQSGNGGFYCNPRVEVLLELARTASDEASYQAALSEIQQIVTRDDPAAIYMAQVQWLTVLRRDVDGFEPDLVTSGLVDFYGVHRRADGEA
jgi:peptide/nickel transport system substrate-binding protein